MTLLEHVLARASWTVVSGLGRLWRECSRCDGMRWRWHKHPGLPVAVVLEMSSSSAYRARRDGGDVV